MAYKIQGAPSRYSSRTGNNGFLDPFKNKSFPGSSGDWLTTPGFSTGVSTRYPGFGYPGDTARRAAGVPTIDPTMMAGRGVGEVPAQNRVEALKAAYDRGEIPFEKLFEAYQLPSRNPDVSAASSKAMGDVAKTDDGIGLLDFNALKNKFSGAESEMNTRYEDFQKGNDITDYAAGQRAADAEAAGLTTRYANTARGQLGDAKGVIDQYRTEGLGALDKYNQNASDFYNKDIPASIKNAQDQATAYTSRYGMGQGGGMSSAIGQLAGESAVRAALPFQLQGRQVMGEALSRYQPFYGDVAARDFNRIANLNMPTEANIYGAQVGDVMRGKATDQQIQNLDMMVKERGLQAAIQNLKNQGLSESIVNSLIGEWQAQKSRSLGLVGQAAQLDQTFGAERGYNYLPGSGPITQPQYFGLPQPNFPNNSPGRPQPSTQVASMPQNGANGFIGPVDNRSPQQKRIDEVMAYTKRNPASNPYGGYGNSRYSISSSTPYNDLPNPEQNSAYV